MKDPGWGPGVFRRSRRGVQRVLPLVGDEGKYVGGEAVGPAYFTESPRGPGVSLGEVGSCFAASILEPRFQNCPTELMQHFARTSGTAKIDIFFELAKCCMARPCRPVRSSPERGLFTPCRPSLVATPRSGLDESGREDQSETEQRDG